MRYGLARVLIQQQTEYVQYKTYIIYSVFRLPTEQVVFCQEQGMYILSGISMMWPHKNRVMFGRKILINWKVALMSREIGFQEGVDLSVLVHLFIRLRLLPEASTAK